MEPYRDQRIGNIESTTLIINLEFKSIHYVIIISVYMYILYIILLNVTNIIL